MMVTFFSHPRVVVIFVAAIQTITKKTAPAPTTTWKKDFFNWNEHEMDGFYGTASE